VTYYNKEKIEIPLLFYKGTKTTKYLQQEEINDSSSYESNFKTDSDMQDYNIDEDPMDDGFGLLERSPTNKAR
jgi:hypothetical protein